MAEDTLALKDKVVVITGASSGIGRVMADHCVRLGMRVAVCARRPIDLGAHVGGRVLSRQVDVSEHSAMQDFGAAVADKLGPIDLWINNAGLLKPVKPLRDIEVEDYQRIFAVNVMGVFSGSQTYVRHLRQVGHQGVLVNISSGAAKRGLAGWSAYCGTKAAVDRLSEAVALEESCVRVHAIAPGVVDTQMQEIIRACDNADFPQVERFRRLKAEEAFNSPAYVAQQVVAIAFDPDRRPEEVILRLADEER